MSDPLVPDSVKKAAKRGFIRTASQSIATSLAGGISVAAVTTIVNGGNPDVIGIAIGAGVAIATPIINGAQSYFSILSKGIPEEYTAAGEQ